MVPEHTGGHNKQELHKSAGRRHGKNNGHGLLSFALK